MPYCHQWDEEHRIPKEVVKKMGEAGFLGGAAGAPWSDFLLSRPILLKGRPTRYAGSKIGGGVIDPKDWDFFHVLIHNDELSRCGSGGVVWGFLSPSMG